MNSFNEREKGFERKFAHDQELQFKASARRNKLLGQWVAGLMGLEHEAAENYAKSVIKADLEEPGDEDVFRKVRKDLDEKNISIGDVELREKMFAFMTTAVEQIEDE